MGNKLYLFVISILFCCSCSDVQNEREVNLQTPKGIKLEPINIPLSLFRPSKVKVSSEYLVVYNNTKENIFNVFSIPDLKYLYSFGSMGQGPGEFIRVDKESMQLEASKFTFLDRTSIQDFYLKDTFAKTGSRKAIFSDKPIFNGMKKMTENSFLFTPYPIREGETDLKKYDLKNEKMLPFGEKLPSDKKIAQNPSLFSSSTGINKSKQKVAQFYYHKPEYKIYDFQGNLLHKNHINIHQDDNQNVIYFTETYATENFIYTLWINQLKSDVIKNIDSFQPDLLVFDWEGNLVEQFKIRVPIITFAVSDDDKFLYATSLNESDDNILYKATLPTLISEEIKKDIMGNEFYSFKATDFDTMLEGQKNTHGYKDTTITREDYNIHISKVTMSNEELEKKKGIGVLNVNILSKENTPLTLEESNISDVLRNLYFNPRNKEQSIQKINENLIFISRKDMLRSSIDGKEKPFIESVMLFEEDGKIICLDLGDFKPEQGDEEKLKEYLLDIAKTFKIK